jgi:sulfur carrier protein
MVVIVNGERHELPAGSTLQNVVELLGNAPGGRGVAVAVSGEVVPRGAWGSTELIDGAQIEVVAAVQGG